MPTTPTIAATPTEPLLYTRQAAAQMLSISVRSLDYMIANKAITPRRIGSRILIPTTELRRVAKQDHPFSVACPAA